MADDPVQAAYKTAFDLTCDIIDEPRDDAQLELSFAGAAHVALNIWQDML